VRGTGRGGRRLFKRLDGVGQRGKRGRRGARLRGGGRRRRGPSTAVGSGPRPQCQAAAPADRQARAHYAGRRRRLTGGPGCTVPF
jgi:hypothetical protein